MGAQSFARPFFAYFGALPHFSFAPIFYSRIKKRLFLFEARAASVSLATMFFVKKVAILGTGLLGASLARALKSRSLAEKVSGWSRSAATRQKCARLSDVFDCVCETPSEAVRNADLAVMCVPTANIPDLSREVASDLMKGAVLTDVGSVKSGICAECEKAMSALPASFVGSHPMAGSEKIGPDFSDANLFDGRPCFVTPIESTPDAAGKFVKSMWEAVGMRVYMVSPDIHDSIVAHVSHLPHLLAGTLCINASKFDCADLRKYAGPGFKDTTRVASGSPEMWDSIVFDNRAEILKALRDYSRDLSRLISSIENFDKADIARRLRSAKAYRDSIK